MIPSTLTPHAILGIPETATIAEAERAWKRLVRALHPDSHPPEKRALLGERVAEINAAWTALRTPPARPTPPSVQHAVYYTRSDPMVADALETLAQADQKSVQGAWIKSLLRGKMPQRSRPLAVVLCSAVVADGKHATLLFEAPLPKGRSAILIPTLHWLGGRLSVQTERPKSVHLHAPNGMVGQFAPFSPSEIRAAGLDSISVLFPSRPLDITKTVRLAPTTGLARLFYR